MNNLIDQIKALINDYYKEQFETYRFKSSEAEENVWFLVENLQDDINNSIHEANYQIECELNDGIKKDYREELYYE